MTPGGRRVAALDCGTNSLRLLILELDPDSGASTELAREMRIVRLGQGVDATGAIAPEALVRVYAALEEYAELIASYHVEAVRCCATSAARDALNAAEFVAGCRARIGVAPEVIAGAEEARLSFEGATRSQDADVAEPFLVVDIGGGSTELIIGDRAHGVGAAVSLDVGSVRLTERRLRADPPTGAQIAAARADIDVALDGCGMDLESARTVIGVAGTVTSVAAGVLGLTAYDRSAVHRSDLALPDVLAMTGRLLGMTVAERRALGYLHPGRADVIGGGVVVLEQVLARTVSRSLLVSESDNLDAIAWSLASTKGN